MKRALILACPVVLVLGLVACGDDDDDTPSTSATATTESLSGATVLPGGSVLPGGTILPGGTLPDLSDVTLPDLSDLSVPENFGEVLQQVFPKLDTTQINCLVDELGDDLDVSKVPEMMQTCNISAADMMPGG